MQLKQSLFIAFALSVICLGAWELYWRSQGYEPNLNDDKALWAVQRAKVDTSNKNDRLL